MLKIKDFMNRWMFKNQWPERIGFIKLNPYQAIWLVFANGIWADGKVWWIFPHITKVKMPR